MARNLGSFQTFSMRGTGLLDKGLSDNRLGHKMHGGGLCFKKVAVFRPLETLAVLTCRVVLIAVLKWSCGLADWPAVHQATIAPRGI